MQVTRTPSRTPWSVDDLKGILAGEDSQVTESLRTADRKGLTPTSFAVLTTAAKTDALMPLLELLEPPTADEASKADLMLDLLERIAESQVRIEARLADIESRLTGQSVPSRQQPVATVQLASRR